MARFVIEETKLLNCWDYENNEITPEKAIISNKVKYHWFCKNNHPIFQNPYSRLKDMCPYCSGKIAIKGVNDLSTLYPKIAFQWDYDKNEREGIDIFSISVNSPRKVYWICEKGHSFSKSVYDMTHKRDSCPICKNKITIARINDLATTNPNLLDEWDYEKNIVKPNEINISYPKKIYWICPNNHSYDMILRSKLKGHKCRFCTNNDVLVGYNDLRTTNPEIIKYWNYDKNKNLTPQMFTRGSSKKVYWICEKGHEWKANINQLTRGQRCPFCANMKVLTGFNDLATLYPEELEFWDYDKNKIDPSDVLVNRKYAYWKCSKGHSFKMYIDFKVQKGENCCPICSQYQRVSVPEKFIFYYIYKFFNDAVENYTGNWLETKEIDIFIPSLNLGIEYDGARYHDDINKDKEKDLLCFQNGIKLIRIRELGCPNYESGSVKINLNENYNSNYRYLRTGLCKLFALLHKDCDIDIDRDLPHVLNIINIGKKNNCIAVTNPEVLAEWDFDKNQEMSLTPYNMTKGSSRSAYWLCEKGHSYVAAIHVKINQNTKCPYCANKKVLAGFNDIATTNPELLDEWDYEKNAVKPNEITHGYEKQVYWTCKNNHSYQQTVVNRIKGCNCPFCSGHRTLKGFNDIETLYPDLMKEWDFVKNSELDLHPSDFTKGSKQKVYWICSKNHSYQATICGRIRGTGCPYCSGKQVLAGCNDLATTHPEVLKNWDYEKNLEEGITPQNISKSYSKKSLLEMR